MSQLIKETNIAVNKKIFLNINGKIIFHKVFNVFYFKFIK